MKLLKRVPKKAIFIILIIIILAVGGIILHNRSVHKAQHSSGTVPNSKKAQSTTQHSSSKGGETTGTSDKAQGAASANSAGLITPFGTFVSNHRPGQNGTPTSEQSVCNTTPGATCDIEFTNGSITKSLGSQVTDASGAASWSWDIKGGTLAPGTWKVTAVVKLNGQTKTTTDPTPLEVQ